MKVLGIVLLSLGVISALFAVHWLLGAGAMCLAIHFGWQWKKERDFVRRALAPGAGIIYEPPKSPEDRETARRRAMGYDS